MRVLQSLAKPATRPHAHALFRCWAQVSALIPAQLLLFPACLPATSPPPIPAPTHPDPLAPTPSASQQAEQYDNDHELCQTPGTPQELLSRCCMALLVLVAVLPMHALAAERERLSSLIDA